MHIFFEMQHFYNMTMKPTVVLLFKIESNPVHSDGRLFYQQKLPEQKKE